MGVTALLTYSIYKCIMLFSPWLKTTQCKAKYCLVIVLRAAMLQLHVRSIGMNITGQLLRWLHDKAEL